MLRAMYEIFVLLLTVKKTIPKLIQKNEFIRGKKSSADPDFIPVSVFDW